MIQFACHSEINNLYNALTCQQNVFRLKISVHNTVGVQMVETSQNLLQYTLQVLFFVNYFLVNYASQLMLRELKYKVLSVFFNPVHLEWLGAHFN